MSEFRLTVPEMALLTGVKIGDERLVLRPTGLARMASWYSLLVVAGVTVAVATGDVGWFGNAVASATVVLVVLAGVMFQRVAVTATRRSLVIQNRWMRKREVPLAEVLGVVAGEEHFARGYFPYSSAWSGPKTLSAGWVQIRDERIRCDALVSYPADPRVSQSEPTAAELKVGILSRWIAAHQDH